MKIINNGSNFFLRVYEVVKRIPEGKVATYGQIAKLVRVSGLSKIVNPRQVGNALHKNSDPKNVPCHRVVDRNGKMAERYAYGGWKEQKRKLLREGVKFVSEMQVDLDKFLWSGK